MEYLYPVRIVASERVRDAEGLLEKRFLQVVFFDSSTANRKVAQIDEGGSVTLDFGREIQGGARLLVSGRGALRLRFGESVGETMAELGERGACNDHVPRDVRLETCGKGEIRYGNTGFRFLRVDAVKGGCEFRAIVAAAEIYDAPYVGGFECDDERVNKIFETAAYTARLCVQNGVIWDGVKHDRVPWVGYDVYNIIRSLECLFGYLPNMRNGFDVWNEQRDFLEHAVTIPSFGAWGILHLYEIYMHGGDDAYVEKSLYYPDKIIEFFDSAVDENGEFDFKPSVHMSEMMLTYVDWRVSEGGIHSNDEKAGLQALMLIGIAAARKLYEIFGRDVSPCDRLRGKLLRKTYKVERFKQVSAFRILAGIGTAHDREMVAKKDTWGLVPASVWYVCKVAADDGHGEIALENLKTYFGAMLDMGATTFWEAFDVEDVANATRIDELPQPGRPDIHGDFGKFCYEGYRKCLGMGYGSVPVPFLIHTVAGIEALERDCRVVRVKPNLCGLKHVKASYPTPYGVIKVEHTLKDGRTETKIDAPKEVKIVKE